MKTQLLILLPLLFFFSCQREETTSIALTVLADRTDAHITAPTIRDVRKLIGNSSDEIHFRLVNIGNTDFNPSYSVHLPPVDVLGNRLERKVAVQGFYKDLDSLIQRENAKHYRYNSSSIYRPLLKALVRTSQTKASRKLVVLYSDLFEASDIFNGYAPRERKQLFETFDKVLARFQAVDSIPDLSGVELYLIYYPTTNTDNRNYRQWLTLYQKLFQSSGLRIHEGMDNAYQTHE